MKHALNAESLKKLAAAGIVVTKDGRIAKGDLDAALNALAASAPATAETDSEELAAGMAAAKELLEPMEDLARLAATAAKDLKKIIDGQLEIGFAGSVENAIKEAIGIAVHSDAAKWFVPD